MIKEFHLVCPFEASWSRSWNCLVIELIKAAAASIYNPFFFFALCFGLCMSLRVAMTELMVWGREGGRAGATDAMLLSPTLGVVQTHTHTHTHTNTHPGTNSPRWTGAEESPGRAALLQVVCEQTCLKHSVLFYAQALTPAPTRTHTFVHRHTHARKGQKHTRCSLKNGTGMKENLVWRGGELSVHTEYEREGKTRREWAGGRRGASANQNKEGVRTNLRALRSLCGRLASGGSRRFRDT